MDVHCFHVLQVKYHREAAIVEMKTDGIISGDLAAAYERNRKQRARTSHKDPKRDQIYAEHNELLIAIEQAKQQAKLEYMHQDVKDIKSMTTDLHKLLIQGEMVGDMKGKTSSQVKGQIRAIKSTLTSANERATALAAKESEDRMLLAEAKKVCIQQDSAHAREVVNAAPERQPRRRAVAKASPSAAPQASQTRLPLDPLKAITTGRADGAIVLSRLGLQTFPRDQYLRLQ